MYEIFSKIMDSSRFGNVPFGVDPWLMLGSTDRRKPTLISREIIFEEFQLITKSPTSQTDRRTTCNPKTYLRPSFLPSDPMHAGNLDPWPMTHDRAMHCAIIKTERPVGQLVPQNRKPKKRRKLNHVHAKLKSVWSVSFNWQQRLESRLLGQHSTTNLESALRRGCRLTVTSHKTYSLPPATTFFYSTFLLPTVDTYSCANFPTILSESQIAFLSGGCEPPILGRGGRMVSGIVPFERALRWWVSISPP